MNQVPDPSAAAETAIREAGGDFSKAAELLRQSLEQDSALRRSVLEQAMNRELRRAAQRLGLGASPCPRCGEDIPLDSRRCSYCGHHLQEHPEGAAAPGQATPARGGSVIRHFTLLTGWVLIVLIVILIISLSR